MKRRKGKIMVYSEIAQEIQTIFSKIAGGGVVNPEPAEPEVAGAAFFLRDGRVLVVNMDALSSLEGGGEDG